MYRLSTSGRYGVGRHYCHIQLSVVVEITVFESPRFVEDCSWKENVYRFFLIKRPSKSANLDVVINTKKLSMYRSPL